jgi:hypothetical protein
MRTGDWARRKEEIGEIAHHVLARAVHLHPFGARADGFGHGLLRVELLAHLVEIRRFHVRAEPDASGIGRERAENQLDERALPRAVRADQAEAVAAADDERQVLHHGALAEALAHALELGHELARAPARGNCELDAPQAFAPRGALGAQPLEALHAAFVARAPRLDTLADPGLFLRPELVEAARRHGFGGELRRFRLLVGGVVARIAAQQAAVKLRDARHHAIQEPAVVQV